MAILGQSGSTQSDRERGAALVEMALVAPILIVLLFGIWSVARAYNVKNTMDHAVREGARFGATIDPWDAGTSPDETEAVVEGELAAAAIPSGIVTFHCVELVEEGNDGCDVGGTDQVVDAPADQIVVRISVDDYELSFIFFSLEIDFSSQAAARYES